MNKKSYLEGAIPYPKDIIQEYTAKGWWENLTMGDILDRSVARYPDKNAVIDGRNRLTYAELKEYVDRFAIALLRLGVKKYDRMLIQLPNRYEFLVAYYAAQRIGAVPVMATPRHERLEISFFFDLTEPVGWIIPVRQGKRRFLPLIQRVCSQSQSLRYLIMLQDENTLPDGAFSMEQLIKDVKIQEYPGSYFDKLRPDPNDIAHIMPTGGTTGLLKGVPRTHNSFLLGVHYANEHCTADDVILVATFLGHTYALQGPMSGGILNGATLVLLNVPGSKEILDAIEREKVTVLRLVPTQLDDILNYPHLDKYDLKSLKFLRTASAALMPGLAARAQEFCGRIGCTFGGNAYGSTEGPIAAIGPDAPPEVVRKSVGRPVGDADHWKVIDEEERELPSNTEGELVVKGPMVFTGYYKAVENEQCFTRDGFYKTGDIGKIDNRGYIYVTGRKKDIIMRAGEGVIPHEIESMLSRHPNVDKVAVVGMPDRRLGERACAYVVLKPGSTFTFDEMISFLKSQEGGVLVLAERLEIVDALPETGIGKVDKRALRSDIEEKIKREEARKCSMRKEMISG